MAGNSYGEFFRVTTWGESHGGGIGAVIDGCPPGIMIDPTSIPAEMSRRRPGQGGASSTRKEPDNVEILSGILTPGGELLLKTTGTPISLVIYNKDAHSKSYDHLREIFRSGHGDISYLKKYGTRDQRGGGRASARETAVRLAAGAIAKSQKTVDLSGDEVTVKIGGRHDISAIPRIIPVCEAMVNLTLADNLLRQQVICKGSFSR